MKAMILAAGLGTRLKPFTDFHPKALALVNGKSLLQRNIEYLQSFGIYEVVVNVHHFADQIKEALLANTGWGSQVLISDESAEVLETGGGVLHARSFFEMEENFLVMNADILTNLDMDKLIAADKVLSDGAQNYIATLAVTSRVSSRNLLFTAEGNLIGWRNNSSREEKWAIGNEMDTSDTGQTFMAKAFSGIQILHRSFFNHISLKGKFSLIDAYLDLASNGTIGYYDHSDSILLDVGKPENIEKAATLFT